MSAPQDPWRGSWWEILVAAAVIAGILIVCFR